MKRTIELGLAVILSMVLSREADLLAGDASLQSNGVNLLRNGDFGDDWITLLPETKNHHWCYPSEFFNRRDYNPDTWICRGSWDWQNADGLRAGRRLVLRGPQASVVQRVNWVAVHDDRSRSGFPDAGGFPDLKLQRSARPLTLVRDLTLRVRLKARDVAAEAGKIELAFSPPGSVAGGDPLGTVAPATLVVSAAIPPGTYEATWVEVKLPADAWLKAAQAAAAPDPKAAAGATAGVELPGMVTVAVRYASPAGQVELEQAELTALDYDAPNLIPNGSFETLAADGYPQGWSRPEKYWYFPPGHYYIFNTWHNSNSANRGPVVIDRLICHSGTCSLKMLVAAGDEKAVVSDPIVLKQAEPRLIEVAAWVKTDQLCMLQIDAVNEQGERLDGFNFIHKAPASIGSDDWRLVRQVFSPRQPLESVRLKLCARGINGYTLDDTGPQPQNNVVGTIWWDDVRLCEPESSPDELKARGVSPAEPKASQPVPHLEDFDLGERKLGENLLVATLVNPGQPGTFVLRWELTSPTGRKSTFSTGRLELAAGGRLAVSLPYEIRELCSDPYTEYRGTLKLLTGDKPVAESELWFGTWTTPIDLELGALYLRPEQQQFVRMNLGLAWKTLAPLSAVRLELVRRGSGKVLKTWELPTTRDSIVAQRSKIPAALREDLTNLVLVDLDVSELPVQPFDNPQRNWCLRATAIDSAQKPMATAVSAAFCRQAHEPPQPSVESVRIDTRNLLYVNDRPWMPWGAIYGHVPVYAGPADPGAGKYRDLTHLPEWSMYDGFGSQTYTRAQNDFNCLRYVPAYGQSIDPKFTDAVEAAWKNDNLYCATFFVSPSPGPWSPAELIARAGGEQRLDSLLAFVRSASMVVSAGAGIEEAFGQFTAATPQQLQGLADAVEIIRKKSGKPVMVGHGGYWNRFEFEHVPFFDIYDPETEPFYPANLHTDLWPLVGGKPKAIWLRPQMYEDVPYERWRFHTYVELMRGCRGWQFAHGPGDASLFRGLHGEMEFIKPIAYSNEPAPAIEIEPQMEHWSRRHAGKTYLIAATTHGIPFGNWRDAQDDDGRRMRVTSAKLELRDESNGYSLDKVPATGPILHGIQYLPDARSWSTGAKLSTQVRFDSRALPNWLLVLVKADGRWTHAAAWGPADLNMLRGNPQAAGFFLRTFYRHANGFLGWDDKLIDKALEYIPAAVVDGGPLPAPSRWTDLEIPLDKIGAQDKLIDGVAFLHDGGRVDWGRCSLQDAQGGEAVVWAGHLGAEPEALARTRIRVAGLKAGSNIRVLFEDRDLAAAAGSFVDDFRGQDLYQRFGAGGSYGDTPVSLHFYEIPAP